MNEPTIGTEYSMADPVIARAAVAAAAEQREQTWDTAELRRDFEVEGFALGMVVVKRRSDGVRGTLQFRHAPRVYFGWQEDL